MKDENKMYSKPQYKCGICGTVFDSIEERMNCEANCIKKQKDEAKKAAEAKKKAEKETRKAEVTDAVKKANELLEEYIQDYGSYEFTSNVADDIKGFWPHKLLHNFWF